MRKTISFDVFFLTLKAIFIVLCFLEFFVSLSIHYLFSSSRCFSVTEEMIEQIVNVPRCEYTCGADQYIFKLRWMEVLRHLLWSFLKSERPAIQINAMSKFLSLLGLVALVQIISAGKFRKVF